MSGNIWMFSHMIDDEDLKILQKDFITYYEGADYYGLGLKVFTRMSHEARAVYKIGKMHDPELLILDEPINGLDPIGIAEVRSFIRELCDARGKTILISSHILSEISLLADDIGIIDHGHSHIWQSESFRITRQQYGSMVKKIETNILPGERGSRGETRAYSLFLSTSTGEMRFTRRISRRLMRKYRARMPA